MDRLDAIEVKSKHFMGMAMLRDDFADHVQNDIPYLLSRVRRAEALLDEIQRRAETTEYEHLYEWIPKQLAALRDADG